METVRHENSDEFQPASGRLFLCIELPGVVKKPIGRLRREQGNTPGISWVPSEKLHLTLRFLGPCDPEFQRKLAARLGETTVRPFLLALKGLGFFPMKGRPSVLWAGLAPADPRLFQLHRKLEALLIELGVEPERRRFRPHVTIARSSAKGAQQVRQIVKKYPDFETAPFQVEGLALYSSELTSEGAMYTRLLEVPFE